MSHADRFRRSPMKKPRLCAGFLVFVLLLSLLLLSGCGKQKKKTEDEGEADSGPQIVEVRLNADNFYDYFDYKEYPSYATDEDGNINACNLSYGFALREGLQAANDPEHKDTLRVGFTAEGVSQNGNTASISTRCSTAAPPGARNAKPSRTR